MPSEDVTRATTSLDGLAPKMREAVERMLALAVARALPVRIAETTRSDARQQWLYASGRSRLGAIVTYAKSAIYGWHFFGLASDLVHATEGWDAPDSFWQALAALAEECGLKSGYTWRKKDRPHVQWGRCKDSPSWRARALFVTGGIRAVWRAVDAL